MSLEPSRVAEVLVHTVGEPRPRCASGYLVTNECVLTAAHVLRGEVESIGLRFRIDQPGGWASTADVAWVNEEFDIAVLRIEAAEGRAALRPVRYGEIMDPIVECHAVGFPRFKVREDPAHRTPDGSPSTYAEYEHAFGPASPWSGHRSRTLGFSVTPPASFPNAKHSPWEGMSGAAVFEREGGGCLVGVVLQHHGREGAGRLTATEVASWYDLPAEELAVLRDLIDLPADRSSLTPVTARRSVGAPVIPPAVLDAATRSYLAWVVDDSSRLTVTALADAKTIEVDLERVYVELKVDFSSQEEREAARINRSREQNGETDAADLSPDQDPDASWQLADGPPAASFLGDPEWSSALPGSGDEVLTIGELYRRTHACVILGDPGSGKTTIARWLALLHAKTLLAGDRVVRVPAVAIKASARAGDFDFGPPLLPVLVRIAEYADDRRKRPPGTRPRTLIEFLCHAWGKSPPTWRREALVHPYREGMPIAPEILEEIFHTALRERRALIILDGLDEVPREERVAVADAVSDFFRTWVLGATPQPTSTRVFATSRVAGYKDAPLPAELTQVTIQPMTAPALRAFVHGRIREVFAALAKQGRRPAGASAPEEVAQRLLDLLDQPENRHVRGLATNPLLAGVVVSVFLDREGALPRQRVELYESAVTMLSTVWRNRLTGTYSERIAGDIFAALPSVAVYIHDKLPTGVIGAEMFRDQMIAGMPPVDPGTSDRTREDAVKTLLKVMEEDLGLLVASGPEAFRFAHRSFQEYLAAQYLIADKALSASRILERLGDSQWREPILMAIGLMNWRRKDAMVGFTRDLLAQDGPLARFFPETALLLAAAIPQMVDVPPAVVEHTTRHLLTSYSTLFREQRMPEIRTLLATAVAALRSTVYTPAVDAVLITTLQQPRQGEAEACATARLIRDIGAVTPELAQALRESASRWDSSEFGSPIAEALGRMVSPGEVPEAGTPRLRLAADSWGGTDLVMRDTLREESALVEAIHRDPSLLSLVVALYGGYWDFGTPADLDEYERLSNYLRLDELTRQEFVVYYASRYRNQRFGEEDPVLAMLTARKAERREATRRFATAPGFDPASIARDSPLTTKIIETLEEDTGDAAATLAGFLRATLASANTDPVLRADALVALWALGGLGDTELSDALMGTAGEAAARRIAALVPGLADAAVRAGRQAGAALAAAADRLPPEAWEQLGAALTKTLQYAGADPVSMFAERHRLPERHLPRLLTEEIAHIVGGLGDRPGEDVERFTEEAAEYPFPLLVKALCSQGSAWGNGYRRYSAWWPADPLAFAPEGPGDIPVAFFDQMAALPASMSHLFEWLLERLRIDKIESDPTIFIEAVLLRYARVRGGDEENRLDALAGLDEYLAEIDRREVLFHREAGEIPDPWMRARAVLRAAELYPSQRAQALADAEHAIGEVTDPVRAFQLRERLALLGSVARRGEHAAVCRELALSITDPEPGARALLRLTRLVPAHEIDELVSSAADRIPRIGSRADQMELLRISTEMFTDRPSCQAVIRRVMQSLRLSGHEEAHVAGNWGSVVSQYLPALCGDDRVLTQALVPVALYGQAVNVVRSAKHDELENAWLRLRAVPGPDAVRQLLDAHPEPFIQCTGPVARSLDQAMSGAEDEFLEPVLDRLVRANNDAEPIVRAWLEHSLPRARQVAALLLAERYRITDLSAESIAPLLIGQDDLLRSRARACVVPGHFTLQLSVSTMGPSAVTTLTEFAHEHYREAPGMTSVLNWNLALILHDDPDALSAWCDAAERAGSDGAPSAASWIVSGIRWISTPAWLRLLDRLREGSPALQATILHAIGTMLYLSTDKNGNFQGGGGGLRIDSTRWTQLYEVLRAIDPAPLRTHRLLPILVGDVFDTIDKVFADRIITLDGRSVFRATRTLRQESATSFGAILSADTEKEVRQGLYRLGETSIVQFGSAEWASTFARSRHRNANRVEGPWTAYLRAWAARLLEEKADDRVSRAELDLVLEALAGAARAEPESFRHGANTARLSHLLADAGPHHGYYPGRAAAATLLGLLRHGSPEVFKALQSMLHDSAVEVRRAALGAIIALRSVDQRLINDLADALDGESVIVAWAAAQLLGVIGENARTPKASRDEVIRRLATAVHAPRSRRTVHFAFADTAMPAMPALDEVFTETLRRVYRLG